MSLTHIGPIAVTHMSPSFSWTSAPNADGSRGAQISGHVEWDEAHSLSELIGNPATRRTVGSHTGVLEYVETTDTLLAPFEGWYLFTSCDVSPDHKHSLNGINGPVPFSLTGVHLGDIGSRRVFLYGLLAILTGAYLVGQTVVALPPTDADPANDKMRVLVNGIETLRRYDRNPHVGGV